MAEYYMFNKPSGCITARSDDRHPTVMDYFPDDKRESLFPVGRLDKETEGFLLLTDDGELCFRLLRPENHIPKTYFFVSLGELTNEKAKLLEDGVKIYKNSDMITSPARIEDVNNLTYLDIIEYLPEREKRMSDRRASLPASSGYITITEGKKHQVRRMIRHVGCKVVYLKRVKMGRLSLDETLPLGKYRALTKDELLTLKSS